MHKRNQIGENLPLWIMRLG